jgi:hypothetical protein
MIYELTNQDLSDNANSCVEKLAKDDTCVIQKNGKEIAVIVSTQQYKLLKKTLSRINRDFQNINQAFADIGQNMTEAERDQFAKDAIKYAREQIKHADNRRF